MFGLLRKIRRKQKMAESERNPTGDERDAATGPASAQSSTAAATSTDASETAADPDDRPVPLDQIFGMLRNHRRRAVLRILTEIEQIELGDLAERVAAREHDKPRERLTSQERKRVYVGLYQNHLPKLADVNAITYNEARGIIEPGPAFDSFSYYLPDDPGTAAAETQGRGWRALIANILN